jgi:hypothetical protein
MECAFSSVPPFLISPQPLKGVFFLLDQIFQPVRGVAPISFKTGMQNIQPVQDPADCLVQFLLDVLRIAGGSVCCLCCSCCVKYSFPSL